MYVCVCVCVSVCLSVCVSVCLHACSGTPFVRPPLLHKKKLPFKRGGLSSEVEINTFMFRFTLSSGLSRGGGLSKGVLLYYIVTTDQGFTTLEVDQCFHEVAWSLSTRYTLIVQP